MMKKIALIGLLLLIALSSTGNANAFVPSMGDKAPALGPGDPISPTGTVTSNVPMFQWSSVSGATNYQVKVKKGSKVVYRFKSTIPTSWVPSILSNKNYKWKVRAKVGGNWQSWSDWLKFTVNASGGFKSSFNKNANGWTKVNGNWKIAKGKYVTSGQNGLYASSMHSGGYSDFTYEVRMQRVWDGTCQKGWPTHIYLRGAPYPLHGKKEWYEGMRFAYGHGSYRIGEYVDGVWNALTAHTSSDHINKKGWNTLLVIAKGNTYWLYINGQFMDTETNTNHATGKVGVGFFQNGGCSDKFKVDWAKLSTSTPW